MKLVRSVPLAELNGHGELPLGAALFTVFLSVLFGANAVAIKLGFAGFGVYTGAGLRFFCASAAVTVYAMYTGISLKIDRMQARQLLVLTLFFITQISLFYHGLARTTASHGTLISNLLPFVVLVVAHYWVDGDRITPRKLSGILFGFLGVVLLAFDPVALSSEMIHGDLVILLAVLLWGISAVYIKKVSVNIHPVLITLYPMGLAAPLLLLAGSLFDVQMITAPPFSAVVALAYQAFVTASFGFIAWNTMIRRYGTTAVHSFVFVMPVSGVLLGVLVLGEPLTWNILGAIFMVAVGIVVVNRRPRQTPQTGKGLPL